MAKRRLTSSMYRVGPIAPVESDGAVSTSLMPCQLRPTRCTASKLGAAGSPEGELFCTSAAAFSRA